MAAHDRSQEAAMIPADIDPSLCAGEPLLDSLDDGFSPPVREQAQVPAQPDPAEASEATLGPKSAF
jgi:hypothetical protein